jgi:hypothetical protein
MEPFLFKGHRYPDQWPCLAFTKPLPKRRNGRHEDLIGLSKMPLFNEVRDEVKNIQN